MVFQCRSGVGHHTRFLVAVAVAHSGVASAHDIPADVTVQLFARPQAGRLQLAVRVPLKAIRDLDFPERERGYLDIEKLAPRLPDAATLWISQFIEIYQGETRLARPGVVATQISLESDRSFTSFAEAVEHITSPLLPNNANVVWNQVMFDVLLEYPIQPGQSAFSIRPALHRLAARVVTVLRFITPEGAVRAFEFTGDPGIVPLDPQWHQAARRFVELGFRHILDGTDHLLFLACLVIPFRRLRALVLVVSAFTVAHSITLIASAFNFAPDALWFPPLIETLIAVSILYMALENIIGATSTRRRWIIAAVFGLIHGFGFSFALRDSLQFAGSHLLTSLLSFNLGVELGQILVLILLIPVLDAVFRYIVAERIGTIILSALVAHTGWHWMIERVEVLRKFNLEAEAKQWLALLFILVALDWALLRLRKPVS